MTLCLISNFDWLSDFVVTYTRLIYKVAVTLNRLINLLGGLTSRGAETKPNLA